jgi:hypothetical protein
VQMTEYEKMIVAGMNSGGDGKKKAVKKGKAKK